MSGYGRITFENLDMTKKRYPIQRSKYVLIYPCICRGSSSTSYDDRSVWPALCQATSFGRCQSRGAYFPFRLSGERVPSQDSRHIRTKSPFTRRLLKGHTQYLFLHKVNHPGRAECPQLILTPIDPSTRKPSCDPVLLFHSW